MDLYRVRGGACVVCGRIQPYDPPVRIGLVHAYFLGSNLIVMDIFLAAGGQTGVALERFSYGYAPVLTESGRTLVPDLRGEWVFVDETDKSAPPLRLELTERIVPDAGAPSVNGSFVLATFRDSSGKHEVRCLRPDRTGIPEAEYGARLKIDGCEFAFNGEVRFSAILDDLGLDRIQAFKGALPLRQEAYRGPQRLLGFRVE